MVHLMRTSGAETLSAIANVFMGQTEAPLIVKPYVPRMTQSELLAMMVGGMATISGGYPEDGNGFSYPEDDGDKRADASTIVPASTTPPPCERTSAVRATADITRPARLWRGAIHHCVPAMPPQ